MVSQTSCTSVAQSNINARILNGGVPLKEPLPKKKHESKIVAFFSRMNPGNWFNDFSDIKITMEEFDYIK